MASKPFYEVGRYEGEITSQGFVKASTGNMQFLIKFKVRGKVEDPETVAPVSQQYERTVYRTLTEKTMDYFFEDLAAIGVTILSFSDLEPGGTVNLVGQVADFYCKHEASQDGGMREKWSVAMASGGSEPIQSAPANEVKALDRLFGKHLKKPNGAPPVPFRVPQPAARSLEVTDDDVPF